MSFLYAPGPWPAAEAPSARSPWRFGRALRKPQAGADGAEVPALQWVLKRNCSLAPCQLFSVYAVLCLLSIGIGLGFLLVGVPAVLPFAGVELLAVGAAFWAYARHAADREEITLDLGELRVEHRCGRHFDHARFRAEWLRIGPVGSGASLVELTSQGQRICVGRYLRPELRPALAHELRVALRHERAHAVHQEFQLEQ